MTETEMTRWKIRNAITALTAEVKQHPDDGQRNRLLELIEAMKTEIGDSPGTTGLSSIQYVQTAVTAIAVF